jgi:hypothetical protein
MRKYHIAIMGVKIMKMRRSTDICNGGTNFVRITDHAYRDNALGMGDRSSILFPDDESAAAVEPASDVEIEQAFRAASDRVEKRLARIFGRPTLRRSCA